MKTLIAIVALFFCQQAFAAWTPLQKWALVYAYQVGAKDDLGMTEDAVVLQESHACVLLVNPDDPSYGCGGLLIGTAQDMLGRPTTAKELMTDHKLNIQLSEKYLAQCIKAFGWSRGLVCYNSGPDKARTTTEKAAESNDYVRIIRGRMEELKSFPISTE